VRFEDVLNATSMSICFIRNQK